MKNTLLTDFFPVRRSDRKSKNEIEVMIVDFDHISVVIIQYSLSREISYIGKEKQPFQRGVAL